MIILKIIIMVIYLIFSIYVWNKKNLLIDFMHLNEQNLIDKVFINGYYIVLVVLIILIAIWLLRKISDKGDFKMNCINIMNKEGQSAKLYKIKKDINNYRKYYFKNYGVPLEEFINKKSYLETALNAKIENILYGKDSKSIIIYGIPFKLIKPRNFMLSSEDTFLVDNPINYLVVGGTGSGKTTMTKILLCNLIFRYSDIKLYILDYKNEDFLFLKDYKRYYGYKEVEKGIDEVYEEFQKRLSSENADKTPIVLFIDEYASFLSGLGKRANEYQSKIAEMLFMGRVYRIVPIIAMQRADSTYFNNGSRDQFKRIIALGNLSKEQKAMLFNDFKDNMNDINKIGEGYVYEDGNVYLTRIKAQKVNADEERIINNCIRNAVSN